MFISNSTSELNTKLSETNDSITEMRYKLKTLADEKRICERYLHVMRSATPEARVIAYTIGAKPSEWQEEKSWADPQHISALSLAERLLMIAPQTAEVFKDHPALNFQAIMKSLNTCKEAWYICQYISEHNADKAIACAAKGYQVAMDEAFSLLPKMPNPKWMETLTAYQDFDFIGTPDKIKEMLKEKRAQLRKSSDVPFFSAAGYGESWNVVPLPSSIFDVLKGYVEAVQEFYPGLIGVETDGMDIPENAYALCLYALSSKKLIFSNKSSLDDFMKFVTLEPADTAWWNGRWFF